jgi:proteic killer suppression protein
MIQTFRCKDTRDLFEGKAVSRFVNIQAVAMRKMAMLNRSVTINDLRVPPGNRLHPLEGDRAGQFSVSVNDQWRICLLFPATDHLPVQGRRSAALQPMRPGRQCCPMRIPFRLL